jgi:hypothetical protein
MNWIEGISELVRWIKELIDLKNKLKGEGKSAGDIGTTLGGEIFNGLYDFGTFMRVGLVNMFSAEAAESWAENEVGIKNFFAGFASKVSGAVTTYNNSHNPITYIINGLTVNKDEAIRMLLTPEALK